ncbi:hypothetical protein F0267_26045 [Vibrio coralliilyticus]|uniref:hypothetical protein n=1 Tax=Vibrio TaxID=662 RepID=UPI00148C2571|nr:MULTISPECIES: hypothetical protein [Vibrio]NOH26177.1 hypothetical protein [Vibrio europaeus]NOH41692.1 hypothetical protein [Vibrio coralliilyticus]
MSTLYVDQILALDKVSLPDNLLNITAFAVVEYNGQSNTVNYSKNVSSITKNTNGAHYVNFIKKPVRDTYAAFASFDAVIGSPYSIQVDNKSFDRFRINTLEQNVSRDAPTVNGVVFGGD